MPLIATRSLGHTVLSDGPDTKPPLQVVWELKAQRALSKTVELELQCEALQHALQQEAAGRAAAETELGHERDRARQALGEREAFEAQFRQLELAAREHKRVYILPVALCCTNDAPPITGQRREALI